VSHPFRSLSEMIWHGPDNSKILRGKVDVVHSEKRSHPKLQVCLGLRVLHKARRPCQLCLGNGSLGPSESDQRLCVPLHTELGLDCSGTRTSGFEPQYPQTSR